MYDTELITSTETKLTVQSGCEAITLDLYSPQGLQLVASLWTKLSTEYRLMYEMSWMGVPVIQLPGDMIAMQELIWKLRPDYIIECGLAHGGSAVFYASLCELIGKGTVIGIDVEVRKYNRVVLDNHPMSGRIRILEQSSVDEGGLAKVRQMVSGAGTVLVVLDSNHSRDHVRQEMELYHTLVTGDSYLVVMDGAQAHVWDTPGGKPEWKQSNPLQAIEMFLEAHPEFESDPHYTRQHVTCCPSGFLRRARSRS